MGFRVRNSARFQSIELVTVSIGLAERGADANSDALMRRADKALYDSKAAGRNRVTLSAA